MAEVSSFVLDIAERISYCCSILNVRSYPAAKDRARESFEGFLMSAVYKRSSVHLAKIPTVRLGSGRTVCRGSGGSSQYSRANLGAACKAS